MKKILKLVIILLFTNTLQATVYYVDDVNGDDTFAGDENHPWKTIQQAANTLIAGDTVYIKAGTYLPTQKIEPQNSGSESNYICYSAYPGDEHLVVIDGSDMSLPDWYGVFSVISKKYLKISGLKVINSSYAGFFTDTSTDIIIENNQTYQTKSSGISVWESDNITVDNNEVSRACWPSGGEQECISIATSNRVLVQNNLVYDGGSIGYGGGGEGIDLKDGCSNSIVYNNIIHDIASVGIYIDAYEKNQSNIQVSDNTVYNIYGVGIATVSEFGGDLENVIVERNTVSGCEDRCMVIHWTDKPDYSIKNIYVQHNTFYNNAEGLDIGVHALGKNINITNNIFSQNLEYQMQYSSDDVDTNELHARNNLIDGDNPSWALFGEAYITDAPVFTDASSRNFHLQSESPAINQAAFLSEMLSSGTGTILEPKDAGYFSGGYGIKKGDSIQFEGKEQQFEIVNTDYLNNTITLNETTSWNTGDGISLAYRGIAPDMGAFEFDKSSGVSSNLLKDAILYPNPTKALLYISEKYIGADYQIITTAGRTVQKGILNSVNINIGKLNTGIYIMRITDTKLNKSVTLKFVKK